MILKVLSWVFLAALFVILFNVLSLLSSPDLHFYTMSLGSSLAGWHSRAAPYPDPDDFIPTRSALKLAVLRNSPVEPEGFTLALFNAPANIAVDNAGKVLVVQDNDFSSILALAEKSKELPDAGNFRNTWVVAQPMTSRPIERILLPVGAEDGSGNRPGYRETSVQGYDGVKTSLRRPVGDFQDLPSSLMDLVGSVLEAREGADDDRDVETISRVKAILGDVF